MNGLQSTKPEIKTLTEKWLVGIKKEESVLTMNATAHWKEFMQRRKEIFGSVENEYYSVQEYGIDYSFSNFNPAAVFKKWAAVAVVEKGHIPTGMENLILPAGKYAVFVYKGVAKEFSKIVHYIFKDWLPSSEYELDQRPHFEFLDKKYLGATNPNSEEEVWIPIRNKIR
ncbi:GyrI-like domain-containing protein [Cellulophaga sp. F20128]|uniref:GyrI-like domain-containing protein n=1 Tax=Cellulophaga sp. F20128 TaxID=2926413 RepID=UPI001FF67036|nr:GyrI-like domain-containing protein [Cellulophaga sp. F20128]MCK0156422.1 GyrI-like domain-containing protein [Cellulophaga sp. F20128]